MDVVRKAGYTVPSNPQIWVKYLAVDSTELPPEGVLVVLVTNEGRNGHISIGKNVNGKLYSVIDSIGAHEIKLSLYRGYLYNII